MGKTTEGKGWIVLRDGHPTRLGRRENVLYFAGRKSPATVFRSRGIAKRRIQWTLDFSEEHGYGWDRWRWTVVMVRGEFQLAGSDE